MFYSKRFPISSKVTNNTLLDDRSNPRHGVITIVSDFRIFVPVGDEKTNHGPQDIVELGSDIVCWESNPPEIMKIHEFCDSGLKVVFL